MRLLSQRHCLHVFPTLWFLYLWLQKMVMLLTNKRKAVGKIFEDSRGRGRTEIVQGKSWKELAKRLQLLHWLPATVLLLVDVALFVRDGNVHQNGHRPSQREVSEQSTPYDIINTCFQSLKFSTKSKVYPKCRGKWVISWKFWKL